MASARDEAVDKRVFQNILICMKCNAKIRSAKKDKAKCRKCGSTSLRAKHKQVKGAA